MSHILWKYGVVIIFLHFSCVHLETEINEMPEDVIPELYVKYRDAVDNDENSESLRRVIKRNREYKIHVKKLMAVNGYKKHNLLIKEERRGTPLIYINNPVESKMPNAYLSLNEFKQLLMNRARLIPNNRNIMRSVTTKSKATVKKPTRTKYSKLINTNNLLRTKVTNKISKVKPTDSVKVTKKISDTKELSQTHKVSSKEPTHSTIDTTKSGIKKEEGLKVANNAVLVTTKVENVTDIEAIETNDDKNLNNILKTNTTTSSDIEIETELITRSGTTESDAAEETTQDIEIIESIESTTTTEKVIITRSTLSRPLVFMGNRR